jgi:hypothetical protein
MKRSIVYCLFSLTTVLCSAQEACAFTPDTMGIPGAQKTLDGSYIETTLKNRSQVRFFKATDGKLYLRLIVTENFYFDKVDVLEIQSETKSYYAKQTRQHKVDKSHGLFLIEIFPNYVTTLKEHGITGISFAQAQTRFTRTDARQVKAIADCLHQSLVKK